MIGKIRVLLCWSRTCDLVITSSDALPLSYRGWSEKSECSFAGVEPATLQLLVRTPYHWAMGDDRKNPNALLLESNLRPPLRLLVWLLCHWAAGDDRKNPSDHLQESNFWPPFRLLARMLYHWVKDGAYHCYCAYVLRISRCSSFLSVMLTNTVIFLRGLKLSGESRS